MTDWVCKEYDRKGNLLKKYVIKDVPSNAKLWYMPTHPKAKVVRCSQSGD